MEGTNEPRLNSGPASTLTRWLDQTTLGPRNHSPSCYLGHPDSQRRFYDWLMSVGKLSRRNGVLTIDLSARKLGMKFAEKVNGPGWGAHAMLEMRVRREGFHIFRRYINITCLVGGPQAYIDYALEDAARLLMLIEKEGISGIKDGRGRRLTQAPVDDQGRLEIREGALRIECNEDIVWLKRQARALVPQVAEKDGPASDPKVPAGYQGNDHVTGAPQEAVAINPGSGLPTIGGIGTPDIGGNQWGFGPGSGM
ncbi:hypothetical protein [Paraburkholderia sp. J8-2]|uniref:hypothetical protein n=1 Tax=Paraburkholderia sp. J8-2 TaxID=2805440 RepID=UPI002AB5F5B3|nr:hypothetical protein [Paraburkholderia sp. J8-2]